MHCNCLVGTVYMYVIKYEMVAGYIPGVWLRTDWMHFCPHN